MSEHETLELKIRSALKNDPAIHTRTDGIKIDVRNDHSVVLNGIVEEIATKRLAFHLTGLIPEVNGVVDKLRVSVNERRSDPQIRADLVKTLSQEPAFRNGHVDTQRDEHESDNKELNNSYANRITVSVEDSVVNLAGKIESLTHRRLAEALCWWTTGVADVDNFLHVEPPEQDSDDEITDALRIVFDKDPLVPTDRIGVRTLDRVVYLEGSVTAQQQKQAAEHDAWYVIGVHKVVNEILVEP